MTTDFDKIYRQNVKKLKGWGYSDEDAAEESRRAIETAEPKDKASMSALEKWKLKQKKNGK
jgi:hypothetical protein